MITELSRQLNWKEKERPIKLDLGIEFCLTMTGFLHQSNQIQERVTLLGIGLCLTMARFLHKQNWI